MKRLALVLLALLIAAPAGARTWYVARGGTGGGTSWADSCSLTTANNSAVAGDYVYLRQGTYTATIDPNYSGSAANGKITYVGGYGGDTTFVAGIYLTKPYITVSNLTAYGLGTAYGVTVSAAHDSLDHVYMPNGVPHPTPTGDYFRIINCTFVADSLHELAFGDESTDKLTGGETDSSNFTLYYTRSGRAAFNCSSTQLLTFTACTFNLTISPTSEGGMWKLYNSSNGKWTDCTWNFTTYRQPSSEANSSRIRNGSHDNRFLRCVWNWLPTTHPVQFLISSTGDSGYDTAQRNNTWYECEFRSAAPSQSPFPWWQAGMRRDSLAYCTIVSAYASAFGVNGVADTSTIVHNTFIKVCPDTLLGTGSPYYTQGTARVIGGEDWTSKPTKVSDNIFYAVDVHADSLKNSYGAAWSVSPTTINSYWGGDYNLWYGELGADSIIYVDGAPHDSTAVRAHGTPGVEAHSKWGDPKFAGGTPTVGTALTFNVSPLPSSPVVGKGSGGSDIGAKAYAALSDSFTVQYAAGTGGTISGTAYQRVAKDSCATEVTASALPHYSFVQWNDSNTDSARTDCSVTADASYTASFQIDTLTIQYVAGDNGSISGAAYQRVAYGGDATTVTAVPDAGYHFIRWMPDSLWTASRTDTSCTADTAYTALFGINWYTATYVAGTGGTCVGLNPQYISYGNSPDDVTARASTGYLFASWTDGETDSTRGQAKPDVIYSDTTFTASFIAGTFYTLTYSAGTGGTIVGNAAQSVPTGGSGTTVTAVPSTGYSFYSWSDSLKVAARRDTAVTADITVSAIFRINSYTLTYIAGTGGTIVGTTPQVVNYGGNGTQVTATPTTGYRFVIWSDGVTTAARTDLNVRANKTVTATFTINTYTLTYIAGAGGSIVGANPQVVASGGNGTQVTATPATHYHFVSWSDGYATAARTDLNVTANKTVTATFALDTYTLTYTAGTGGTIVGTSPQTVSYGYNGTTVTATASAGYAFYAWSDSVKTAARTDLSVTANVTVSAIFNSIYSPSGTAGIKLSATHTTFAASPVTFTITNDGSADLHVYSVTLYHVHNHTTRAVSCTKSASTATIAASETLDVTLSSIVLRSRLLPYYRVTVTSDAGTKSLNLTYDPCQ